MSDAPSPSPTERVPPIVHLLGHAIAREPHVAVHYLLRGEEWLLRGQAERARADFLRARELAAQSLARSDWGYINQAYCDRAEAGLRQCEQRMPSVAATAESAFEAGSSDF